MDKQKQIEEMEKTLYDYRFSYDDCIAGSESYLAKHLIEKGWTKPAENAVVLTREEYEWLTCCFGKFEEIMNDIKEQSRKETAKKFAQALENRLDSIDTILHEDNEEEYLSANELGELIDEICKEFTGDKNAKNE